MGREQGEFLKVMLMGSQHGESLNILSLGFKFSIRDNIFQLGIFQKLLGEGMIAAEILRASEDSMEKYSFPWVVRQEFFHIFSFTQLNPVFSPILTRKQALAVAHYLDICEIHVQGKTDG